jgi:hypothetical protein
MRVFSRGHGVLLPDPALPIVNHQLAAAFIAKDLARAIDGLILAVEVGRGLRGSRREDVPAPAFAWHDVSLCSSHPAPFD